MEVTWQLTLAQIRQYKSSAVAEMGGRLATINIGQKLGAVLLSGGGSSVPM